MRKDIPHIDFNPRSTENYGFEIVSIDKIAKSQNQNKHNSELPHQLAFYNLIYFTEGEGRHFIDFNWYPVKQNTLVYLAKGQVNGFDFSSNLKGFCIVFTEEYFLKLFSSLSKELVFRLFNPQLFTPTLEIPDESDFNIYFNLLNKELSNPKFIGHKTIVESLFIVLITKAENIKQYQTINIKDSANIKIFQNFITLLEKQLNISRSANYYSKELAITYKHLNTICKEFVNKTAKNVIDEFVILQAKRNLINSNIKSNELAYKLGFEDPTNFTKYFKKHTGFTPKSFINSFKTK